MHTDTTTLTKPIIFLNELLITELGLHIDITERTVCNTNEFKLKHLLLKQKPLREILDTYPRRFEI